MGFGENLRTDLKNFGTLDIMLAVVFGVIMRIYMIIGSPLINILLHGSGVVGDMINACLFLLPLYALLLLPGGIRSNGLTCWLAAVLMSLVRVFTGDPFGIIALQAYLVAGLGTWLTLAAMGYRRNFKTWFVSAFVWTFFVDGVFGIYFGVFPFLGSFAAGLAMYLIVERIINGLLVGAIVLGLLIRSEKVASVRAMMVTRT
jgi:hypothetical protein